jgi:phospholipid/cholesterol/gamma-HCH transport system substrate-binding protein
VSKGVYEMPLPGGADVGNSPIRVIAEFDDVLDLVPHSSVKLEHVDVGRVTAIELSEDGNTALAHLEVRRDVELPADSAARLQQTSLLGEKYVALLPGESEQLLADGGELPTEVTSRSVSPEEVLGALSMLLNGGGVGQLQTISRELQAIGGDRTAEIRAFLNDLGTFVQTLNENRDAIVDAIDGLGELSEALADNEHLIERTLEDLTPGVEALSDQQADMVAMMQSLDELSEVTVDTLTRASKNIVEDFELLAPVLKQLAAAGDALPRSLELMLTFPFTDEVLNVVKGDYFNVFITMSIRNRGSAQPQRTGGPPLLLPGEEVVHG